MALRRLYFPQISDHEKHVCISSEGLVRNILIFIPTVLRILDPGDHEALIIS